MRFDASIFQFEDRFEIQCRSNEARRAADAPASMQEFKRFDNEINSHMLAGFLRKRNTFFHAGALFCGARCG